MSVIFDRKLVRQRRRRIAAGFARHDFLKREVGAALADRLAAMNRDFPDALDLGSHFGSLPKGDLRIGRLIRADLARNFTPDVVADEEALPFAAGRLDLVFSVLSLHWVNDLPGTLRQIVHMLKPEGIFIGALFGVGTLTELRDALSRAEVDVTGGLSPHISPFLNLPDGAPLLQRAGFTKQVADAWTIPVTYADPIALMRELRGMGETNALIERRRKPLRKAVLARAMEIYAEDYSNADGRIRATFEIVTLTGWK